MVLLKTEKDFSFYFNHNITIRVNKEEKNNYTLFEIVNNIKSNTTLYRINIVSISLIPMPEKGPI